MENKKEICSIFVSVPTILRYRPTTPHNMFPVLANYGSHTIHA